LHLRPVWICVGVILLQDLSVPIFGVMNGHGEICVGFNKGGLKFQTNRDPVVAKVVSASKDFKVPSCKPVTMRVLPY